MVGTISPVVYGRKSLSVFGRVISLYGVAQVAGAVVTGLCFGVFGVALRALFDVGSEAFVLPVALLATLGGLGSPASFLSAAQPQLASPTKLEGFSPAADGHLLWVRHRHGSGHANSLRQFYVLLAGVFAYSLPLAVSLMAVYGLAGATTVALIARSQVFAEDPWASRNLGRLGPVIGVIDGLLLARWWDCCLDRVCFLMLSCKGQRGRHVLLR